MVVNSSRDCFSTPAPGASGGSQGRSQPGLPDEVVWHDLECGSYRADLPLWRELAEREGEPILDIGAGSGRVTLELAGAGHRIVALDLDRDLLEALRDRFGALRDRSEALRDRDRSGAPAVQTVCADARSFDLAHRDFALCLVPMQTIQLLGDASGRRAFLRCAHAHLRPGGLLACAIATGLEPFDIADGVPAPTPETARLGDRLYVSQAESVRVLAGRVVIARSRKIMSSTGEELSDGSSFAAERNVIELTRIEATEVEREGLEAGFSPEPARVIEPTEEHVGSVVVMLRV
ncbi:MAG: class I SAM-dependent methyltransferase [Solirubrobacteraceae bacterium]